MKGYKSTEVGEVPAEWELRRLGEIVDNFDKKRKPISGIERAKMKGEYPYCGANGIVDYINSYIFDGEYVLLAEDGGYWGKSKNSSYLMKGKFWVNNHAHIIVAKEGITTNHYLSYALNFLNIDPFIGGDARGKLTQAIMNSLLIPLPPIQEQQNIAHLLSKIQSAIETQEKIIRTTTELKKALMQRLFTEGLRGEAQKETEIGRVPKSWEVVKLKEIVNFATGKLNANQAEANGKYPFFTCSQETFWINKYAFDTEAVLLSGNNARAVYSVKYYKGKFNAYQRTYVITLKDVSQNSYLFLKHILSLYLERLRILSIGTSTKYLTLGILENLEVIKPSKEEQEQIANILSSLEWKIESAKTKLISLRSLFHSMLHHLMIGQIRVKDIRFL